MPMLLLYVHLLGSASGWRFGAELSATEEEEMGEAVVGSEGSRIYVMRWWPAGVTFVIEIRIGSTEPFITVPTAVLSPLFGEIICPEVVGDSSPFGPLTVRQRNDERLGFGIAPGVASFALTPAAAGASLEPLIRFARKTLHEERHRWGEIPLFLRATAGMRLLFPDERESILDAWCSGCAEGTSEPGRENIRTYFRTLPFLFRDDMASVATGEEEGVFGWISANYLMGNLKPDEVPSSHSTVGSLDLGGASTQIVFMPQKSTIQHAFPLHLGPHRVQVYSYSFLHFGQREALAQRLRPAAHRTASTVISDALLAVQSETTVSHPCFAKGYIYTPMFSYSGETFAPIQARLVEVKMNGTSDFQGCEDLVKLGETVHDIPCEGERKRIFNKDAPCLIERCLLAEFGGSFYGVYQPRVYAVPFLAFAHFAEIVNDLGLPADAQLEDLKTATRYVCSLTMRQLEMLFARVTDEYVRTHLCFHATFAYTLLHYGYELKENQITFKSTHGGKPIDWAVGAMIYEINQEHWREHWRQHWTTLLLLFVFLCLNGLMHCMLRDLLVSIFIKIEIRMWNEFLQRLFL
ncbi:Ectonucleoside triphosphate diphosphohydrolase 3 (NTPDase 3) (CD39 antigen-like 3) (Ecto-ATP diphosphohydrolase 3) (Ecto-ATPDase 3) (Ecto-ATPase 3) (Ecto-apyrase 3) (HB6) [Durusdinium trenchii]|uniref:Ectonucleoside triphosphate diphosphohydrolase 3 (NTPDase 3) (CD39 antigen-like 3) (Ecto-ATP diphosphohydrolase 3) (Ecto-ATPDase 3) (Ecto-ATPase 3) (Ecto-apyrase 3) (HB6) n=1 Tax=Durusdinium trenchii TaxID=1381693 RepID=A0ABP0KXS8_9DINO